MIENFGNYLLKILGISIFASSKNTFLGEEYAVNVLS